jgi:hydrogenase expression/formation protein HypC
MCLAYPAQVLSVHGSGTATVRLPEREQDVLLAVLDDDKVAVGDWLLVQSGLALARIDESEAAARLELLNTPLGGTS